MGLIEIHYGYKRVDVGRSLGGHPAADRKRGDEENGSIFASPIGGWVRGVFSQKLLNVTTVGKRVC